MLTLDGYQKNFKCRVCEVWYSWRWFHYFGISLIKWLVLQISSMLLGSWKRTTLVCGATRVLIDVCFLFSWLKSLLYSVKSLHLFECNLCSFPRSWCNYTVRPQFLCSSEPIESLRLLGVCVQIPPVASNAWLLPLEDYWLWFLFLEMSLTKNISPFQGLLLCTVCFHDSMYNIGNQLWWVKFFLKEQVIVKSFAKAKNLVS